MVLKHSSVGYEKEPALTKPILKAYNTMQNNKINQFRIIIFFINDMLISRTSIQRHVYATMVY